MKTLITIILTLFSLGVFSQEITSNKQKKGAKAWVDLDTVYSGFNLINFGYSQKFYKFNFQNEMKSLGKIEFNSLPVNSITANYINITNYQYGSRIGSFPFVLGYQYIIPTQVTINDTSIQTLNGYNITFSLSGQKIITKPYFSLFITEGLRFGRIKLKDKNRVRIKNPINAMFVASVMRVSFSYFSIFATAQYDLDFSPKKWRKMWFYKKQDIVLPNFSHSGLEFRVGINFSLHNYYKNAFI